MIQFIILLITSSLIGYDSLACNETKAICRTICKYVDHDEDGDLINGKCKCMNDRDITREAQSVPKNGAAIITKKHYVSDE